MTPSPLHTPQSPSNSFHTLHTLLSEQNFRPLNPLLKIPRNPESHSRPTFEGLARELARNPEALLSWSEQDKAASSKAVVLGAALEEGKPLYQELQQKYK